MHAKHFPALFPPLFSFSSPLSSHLRLLQLLLPQSTGPQLLFSELSSLLVRYSFFFFFFSPFFSCSCCLPAPHHSQFHKKPQCSRPHYFFSVALVSLTRTFQFLPVWHSLIKSRKENQFPLPWWNDMSFTIMPICHSVTTLCHAEHWTDHLLSDHSSQLIITTMSSMTSTLSSPSLMHRDRYLYLIPVGTISRTVCETRCWIRKMWMDWAPVVSIFTVFTPRVVSTAVARYNFAARDMRELSLREGDIVKIYSKIGGDQGWWKGEANGRVSQPWMSVNLWMVKLIRVIMGLDQKGHIEREHFGCRNLCTLVVTYLIKKSSRC